MTSENNPPPERAEPEPPEVDAEAVSTALTVQESPPAEPPPPNAAGRSPGFILLVIFAAALAIASVAFFTRQRAPAEGAAVPGEQTPEAVTIELPAAAAAPSSGGAHDAPGPANPSPEKIFNDATSFKENLSDGAPAATEGYVNELPPAPHAAPGANSALIDAAKRALEDNDADAPQTEEPEAALAPYDAQTFAALETEARRALAFSALAAKARSGAPYAEELKAFLAERQDAPFPAVIADRAAAGVPTATALALSFAARHREALAAGRRAEASGPGARAAASLASLFYLRPSGPAKGATTAAILSRVEAAAAAGDLKAAVAEASALRPEAAAALSPWLEEAETRLALEAALTARENALQARLAGGRL